MESGQFWQLGALSDTGLRSALAELLTAGYRTEARIIAHLAEVEQRKLHLKDGSESLYHYCTTVLRLSNSEAFQRITAARVARRFPLVFALVEQRKLHLSAVCLLRDYLSPENHLELLSEASHKTKWQIEQLLARRFPRPDVESRIRKLPAPRLAARPAVSPPIAPPPGVVDNSPNSPNYPNYPNSPDSPSSRNPLGSFELAAGLDWSQEPPFSDQAGAQPASLEPEPPQPNCSHTPRRVLPAPVPVPVKALSEARYRIQLNASAALKEKLDRLRALTSHSNPSGDLALVIERALDVALEQVEKRRFAKTNRPRASRPKSFQTKLTRPKATPETAGIAETKNARPAVRTRDHIPNAVLREIAERDDLQCSFRSESGCRCTARAFLQVHHAQPWARGGAETTGNLRLLCASHNRLLAERDFGVRHIQARQDERRRETARPPDSSG